MKALTIRQPYASLVVAGAKPVENRTFRTRHRGPLLIHAGKGVDRIALAEHRDLLIDLGLDPDRLPAGGIMGRVELHDVVTDSPSEWAVPGQMHWLIRSPVPLPFQACCGALGLWEATARAPAGGRTAQAA